MVSCSLLTLPALRSFGVTRNRSALAGTRNVGCGQVFLNLLNISLCYTLFKPTTKPFVV